MRPVAAILYQRETREADNTDLLFNPETIPIHSRTTTPELELIEDEDISQAIEAFPERVEEQLHQPIQQPANAAREAAAEMLNAAIANLPLRAEKLLKPRPAPYQIPKKKILPPPAWVDTPDTPNLTRAERLRTIDEAESLNLPKKAASEPSRSPKKKTYPVKQRPGKNILKKYRASKGGKSKTDDDLPPDFYQIFDETQPPKKGRKRSRTESQGEGGEKRLNPQIEREAERRVTPALINFRTEKRSKLNLMIMMMMMMIIPLLVKKKYNTPSPIYIFFANSFQWQRAPRAFLMCIFSLASPLNCKLLEKDRKRETGSNRCTCVRACLPRV